MSDFEKIKLNCTHAADIHFEGRVVHEYTTQNKARTKSRWTELRLWDTRGGNWIAEAVGRSDNDREFNIVEATVIEPSGAEAADPAGEQEARLKVMDAWGWTTAAKAFAREVAWDVIRRVE